MNLNPQAKMAGGTKFTSTKPKDMPPTYTSSFMQQQLASS
jgi:hypothetical protein